MSVWHSLPEMKALFTIRLKTRLLDLLRCSGIPDDSIIRSTLCSRTSFSLRFDSLILAGFADPRLRKIS